MAQPIDAPPLDHWTCLACGAAVSRPHVKGQRPKWCPACRALGWRSSDLDRHCKTCGKPGIRQGKRYCSPTCRPESKPRQGDASRIFTPLCAMCGRCFTTRWPHSRWCSQGCAAIGRQRPSCRIFTPLCVICGRCFTTRWTISTCSSRCADAKRRHEKRRTKQRRRALKRDAFVANVSPRYIYERDGWRCQLCGKAIRRAAEVPHPLAPTIDHIIPLAAGGTHEPRNCQAAHYLCNSLKGDRGTDQLRLIG